MTSDALTQAGQALTQSAQQLLDAAQSVSQGGTFDLPLAVGKDAFEALSAWDDAVLQTLGTERDRYADNLQGKALDAATHAHERLALAVWLAVDFPADTFEAAEDTSTSLMVTWQPEHSAALKAALEAAAAPVSEPVERTRAPKP